MPTFGPCARCGKRVRLLSLPNGYPITVDPDPDPAGRVIVDDEPGECGVILTPALNRHVPPAHPRYRLHPEDCGQLDPCEAPPGYAPNS